MVKKVFTVSTHRRMTNRRTPHDGIDRSMHVARVKNAFLTVQSMQSLCARMLLSVSQEMCEQNRAERAENRLSRGRAVNGHLQKMPERGWGAESGYGSGSANSYMGFPADKSADQSPLTLFR